MGYFNINIILMLFDFTLILCSGVLAINNINKNSVLKNSSEYEEYKNIQSRTLNGNSNEKNLDIWALKGLIQKVTSLKPLNYNKDNTLGSQINFSQNLEMIMDMLQKLENKNCVRDMQHLLNGLILSEKWALQMFDAFPKFPLGLLYGNMYQLGNFDECTSVRYMTSDNIDILGQYCLADIAFKLYTNNSGFDYEHFDQHSRSKFNTSLIHWAICLPSTCKPQEVSIIVKEIFTSLIADFKTLEVIIQDKNCYFEENNKTTVGEIIYGCVIAVFLLFLIFATIVHIFHIKNRKKCITYNIETIRSQNRTSICKEILLSFSLIQTIKKLLTTKPTELNLECICGIKFLSMSFIVIGHSLIFILGGPVANANFSEKLTLQIEHGLFLNSPLMVDTFLLVSGFLMCRLLLLELDKRKGKINFLILYITRYIRLTPAYLVILGFYLTWLPKLGNGPLWNEVAITESQRCQHSWWTNLLYVNNYVETDSLCMFQAWYLAVDYHLFILAPFVIYPLWKWNKTGSVLLATLTIGVAIIPAYFTYMDNLDPTFLAFSPEIQDLSTNYYFVNAYIKTHMRAHSYILGLVFGYAVHKIQSNGTKIPSLVIWTGWILAALFGIVSMFSIFTFFEPNHNFSNTESAIYAPLHRIAWCLAIGWIIVICVTDNAAMVNKLLSCKFFMPLSRLTYCAYLVNGLVIIYHKGTVREAIFLSKFQLAYTLIGHLVLTFFFAFFLCICCESPIHGLEKILLRKRASPEKHNAAANTVRVVEENGNNINHRF